MTTMTSQVTSTAQIYVVAVVVPSLDPIANPVDYISQPAQYQEALARAGLPAELVFLSAVLRTVITIGDVHEYHLELGFDAAPVFASGHYHNHTTIFLPLRESYRDGPEIDLDPTLGPVRITSPDDSTDFLQVQKGSEDLLLIRAEGTIRVGTNIEMYPDNTFDIVTPDGGGILRRPRDVWIGRNLYVGGAGEFVEEARARNFQFLPQNFNPDTDPASRHIFWNAAVNEPYAWDGLTGYSLKGGGVPTTDNDGVIFIENLTPDVGNINCAFAENGTRVTTAVVSPDVTVITVHVFAYTGHERVRPVVNVNGTPTIWSTLPQKDPTAYEGTVDISGFTLPLTITAVHQDGNDYEIIVYSDAAPQITTLDFTGGYLGTQTELKAGDTFDINIQTDLNFVAVEVQDSGACSAMSFSVAPTTNHTFAANIANRGTTTQAFPARVRVQKSTGTWSDWVYTNAGGGTIDGVNLVNLNNLYPSVDAIIQASITYPATQEAIKDAETVIVHSTCTDFDVISYTSPNAELSIPSPSIYQENKAGVQRAAGGYNITSLNYRITATRTANDAITTEQGVVYIAHDFAQVQMTEPASRLRTGGNDGTSAQDHTITLTANQRLISAPTIAAPPAGGGVWQGVGFAGGPEVWTRDLQCHDNDTVGTYSYGSLLATNLANRVTTAYTGDSNYTIGGFVSRTVTLAAFANQVDFNAAVADYSKCTLVWAVKSLPNKRAFNTTTTPDANSWCFAGTIGVSPTIARILDTAATGSSSNATDVTVEESV